MSASLTAKMSQFLLHLIFQFTGLYFELCFKDTTKDYLPHIKMGNENSCPHIFLLFK